MNLLNFAINKQHFLQNYFEQQFLYQRQALNHPIISLGELNQIIYAWDPADLMLRLHQDGTTVSPTLYTETYQDVTVFRTRLLPEKFVELLNAGATLLLNRLEKKSPMIGKLCHEISQFSSEYAVANGYIAFGGEGTFGRHWDTHDVFAVQLLGRKHWKVFAPTYPLPLPGQTSKDHKQSCPAIPVFDDVLEAGDVLYLPRGWWHETIPLQNEPTVHVAIGLHTAKAIDYLTWLLEQKLPRLLPLRVGLGQHADNAATITAAVAALMQDASDPDCLDEFLGQMGTMINKHYVDFLPKQHIHHASINIDTRNKNATANVI